MFTLLVVLNDGTTFSEAEGCKFVMVPTGCDDEEVAETFKFGEEVRINPDVLHNMRASALSASLDLVGYHCEIMSGGVVLHENKDANIIVTMDFDNDDNVVMHATSKATDKLLAKRTADNIVLISATINRWAEELIA